MKYNDLDKFNHNKIWETYKEVIPAIGSSGVDKSGLNSDHREIIQDFRIRYLEEQ